MRREMAEQLGAIEWYAVGLASGTFVALAAEERASCLSGLYVNAERDLEEVITEIESGMGMGIGRVESERLYVLRSMRFRGIEACLGNGYLNGRSAGWGVWLWGMDM